MRKVPTQCTIRHFILSPREIHYLRFTLEAYEGIGVVTTLEPKLGLIRLSIAPGCEPLVEHILDNEREQLGLQPIFLEETPTRHGPP